MDNTFGTTTNTGTVATLLGNNSTQPAYEGGSLTAGVSATGEASLPAVLSKLQTAVFISNVTTDEVNAVNAAAAYLILTKGEDKNDPTLGVQAVQLAYSKGYLSDVAYQLSTPLGTPIPQAADAMFMSDWAVLSTAIPAISTVATNAMTMTSPVDLSASTFTLPKGQSAVVTVEYRASRVASGDTALASPGAAGAFVEFRPNWNKINSTAVSGNRYSLTVQGSAFQVAAAAVAAIPAGTFEYRYVVRASRTARTGSNQTSNYQF